MYKDLFGSVVDGMLIQGVKGGGRGKRIDSCNRLVELDGWKVEK